MRNISREELKAAADQYMDHKMLADTAQSMGANETAEAERQAASEVRQGLFGPDSQFS